jgi:hypothetical protein
MLRLGAFSTTTRLGFLLLSSAWLITGACVSEDENPGPTGGAGGAGGAGGTAGAGGNTAGAAGKGGGAGTGGGTTGGGAGTTSSGGTAGAGTGGAGTGGAGTGGTAGTTGGGAGTTGGSAGKADAAADAGPPVMCPPPVPMTLCTPATPVASALVSDFTAEGGPPPVFGAYGAPIWGGVYAYPGAPDPCSDAGPPMFPITSDVSAGSWHLSGTVGTYSGFGLWWNCTSGGRDHAVCAIDASAYSGIQFSIRGNAGPMGTVGFSISTADDSAVSTDATKPSCGTCTAAVCTSPSFNVPVSTGGATVTLRWSDFTGGAPNALDPTKITGIAFTLPWATGTHAADVTIDDIRFVSLGDAGPTTPDAPVTDAPGDAVPRDSSAD